MKRNFLFAAALVLSVGALASCGDTTSSATSVEASVSTVTSEVAKVNGTATEYGIVNTDCVTSVTIVVEDDLTTNVTIDETFTPIDWASINAAEVDGQTIETVDVTADNYGTLTTYTFAKFIQVDGKVYTATAVDADKVENKQLVNYANDDCADLFTFITENNEWYFNAVKDGKISVVADAEGAVFDTPYTLGTITKYTTNFKADADNSYWPVSDWAPLGWKGNIAKIETALTGNDLSATTEVLLDDTTSIFSFDGVETGATMTGTPVYVTLATTAYATLVA